MKTEASPEESGEKSLAASRETGSTGADTLHPTTSNPGGTTGDGAARAASDASPSSVAHLTPAPTPSPQSMRTGPLQARRSAFTNVAIAVSTGLRSLSLDERLGRIILSLILAVLLWFYVTSLENPAQTTKFSGLSLEVRNLESDLKVISPNPFPTVEVTLQAPQNIMSTLTQADVRPYINLRGLNAGVHTVPVAADFNGQVGQNLTNISVRPDKVQIQLEVQATRVFTIGVRVIGTPAFGYGIEQSQVSPGQVSVTGSESAIDKINHVLVTVDVDGKAGTQQGFKSPVAYESSDQEVTSLTFNPTSVEVVVPIKLLFAYRLVPVHIPIVGNPAPGYSVSDIKLDPTNVTICCAPSDVLEAITSLETSPVSISGTTSTVISATRVILPPGVDLYPGQTGQITVTVAVNTFNTTWQLSVAPTLEGLPTGYGAVISPNSLDLTLAGTFAQFQNLKPADVRATVSVAGLGPGTYNLAPQVTLPEGIKLDKMTPDIFTVSVIAPTPVPATPTAVSTRVPTSTLLPTATPSPTGTPAPTQTSSPTPTHSPALTSTPGGSSVLQTGISTPAPLTP